MNMNMVENASLQKAAQSLGDGSESPNLVYVPGEGGGYEDWNYEGWDWGGGGDWSGDGTGSMDDWQTETPIQTVEIHADKMTLWEKIQYDAQELSTKVASVIDNAITAFHDRGYISVGANVAGPVGIAVTVDANHDIYVGVYAGRSGGVTLGTTPTNTTQSEFLSAWGVTVVSPIGIGMSANDSGMQIAVGTPGGAVGYNVNVSQAWRDGHQMDDVISGARAYLRDAYGVDRY